MGAAGRAYRRFESLHSLWKDAALALVLTVALLADLRLQEPPSGGPAHAPDLLGYVLVAMMVAPLALRRMFPMAVYLTVLVATVTVAVMFYRPASFGFGLLIATYTVARWCERRASLVTLGVGLAFGILIKLRAAAVGIDVGWFSWPLDAIYFGAAWFLGDSIRTRLRYADELERNRIALARQAVAEERVRIARELHDAMGHSVSVMVLHAGGGEELLDRDPERARGAFRAIAQVGRQALAQMDELVGLLRSTDTADEPLPPTLDGLTGLLEGYRDLGLDIRSVIGTAPEVIPPGVERSAYRIIEEALTNTMKHAGPTAVEVSVAHDAGQLHVQVRDHGGSLTRRPLGRDPHIGRGLLGIRERALALGGEVLATPHPEGGFVVTATLPYARVGSS